MRFLPVGFQHGKVGRLSPYLFSQHGVRNWWYLPKSIELPTEGLLTNVLVYDWGFNAGSVGLAALDTQNILIQMQHNSLIHSLTGFSDDTSGINGASVGFLATFYHTHKGVQRRLFSKHLGNLEVLGTNRRPEILESPYLLLKGDSLECEVKNLASPVPPATTRIQVLVTGGEFD